MIFKKALYASTNVQSERFFETIYKNYFLKTWVFELILRDFKEKVLFLFTLFPDLRLLCAVNVDQIGSPPAHISNTCLIPKPDGCDIVDKKLSK